MVGKVGHRMTEPPARVNPLRRPALGRSVTRMEKSENEDAAMHHVVDRLTSRFPSVPPDEIEARVAGAQESLDDAPVRDFVPIIVEHDVKAQLREEGNAPEPAPTEPD